MPSIEGLNSILNFGVSETSQPFEAIQKRTFNIILLMVFFFAIVSLFTNIIQQSWLFYDTVLYSNIIIVLAITYLLLYKGYFEGAVILFLTLGSVIMFVFSLMCNSIYTSSLSSLVLVMIAITVLDSQKNQLVLAVLIFVQQVVLFYTVGTDYSFAGFTNSASDVDFFPLERSIVYLCFYWFLFAMVFSLKKQIAHSAIQLNMKNEEIKDAYNEMEKFGHVISHDLKSPIRNMTNFAGLISRKLKTNQYEKVEEYAKIIQDSGAKAIHLIDDVLTFSKLNNDEQQELKSTIGLDALLIEVENDLLPLYPKSVVKFNQLGEITGNYSKLKILFQNLIENGLKYNQSHNPIIRIIRHKDKAEDYIRIEDNGIGIDEKHYALIFEPFKRLHNETAYAGSGIGLASCKSIVNEHLGGSLTVSSAPNEGSVFTIQLPLA